MNENIFVVGPEVCGESQIGYDRFIDEYAKMILTTNKNLSIVGIKRYGKTSLIKESLRRVKAQASLVNESVGTVEEQTKEKLIVIYLELAGQRSFEDMLEIIVDKLEDELIEDESIDESEILENRKYGIYKKRLADNERSSATYRNAVFNILKFLKKSGYRIILTIDEFDAAMEIFHTTAEFEFLRDIAADLETNVSLVLVSRRLVYMIEKKNVNNSTLHGILETQRINGFNEEDFEKYYQLMQDKYEIVLSEEQKEKLDYYCGRSPYLISMFSYHMVEMYQKDGVINIDAVFEKCRVDVDSYHKSIIANLMNDKIEVQGALAEASTIEKLIGVIIGPKLDLIPEDLEILKSLGYLYHENGRYYSISKHFTNALSRVPVSMKTWDEVITVEKKVKTMIRRQVMLCKNVEVVDFDTWEELFVSVGVSDAVSRYENFVDTNMREYKRDTDLLDACSLDLCVKIIKKYWDDMYEGENLNLHFAQFFKGDWVDWEDKFALCVKARNPMAHGHEEYLTLEDKNAIHTYSRDILKAMVDSLACLDIPTLLKEEKNIKRAEVKSKYYSLGENIVDDSLLNKKVDFVVAVQESAKLRGYFEWKGKFYKLSINRNKWITKFPGVKMSEHLSNTYPVKITIVDKINQSLGAEIL